MASWCSDGGCHAAGNRSEAVGHWPQNNTILKTLAPIWGWPSYALTDIGSHSMSSRAFMHKLLSHLTLWWPWLIQKANTSKNTIVDHVCNGTQTFQMVFDSFSTWLARRQPYQALTFYNRRYDGAQKVAEFWQSEAKIYWISTKKGLNL